MDGQLRQRGVGTLRTVRERWLEAVVALVAGVLLVDLLRLLVTGEVPVSQLFLFVWDGLLTGLILGLAGIGLTLTYSILGFANFSHGDVVTAGSFFGWSITYVIAGFGTFDIGRLLLIGAAGNLFASDIGITFLRTPVAVVGGVLAAAVLTAGMSLVFDRYVYRPLRNAGEIMLLIGSIGVAFIIRYLIATVYTPTTRAVTVPPSTVFSIGITDGAFAVATSKPALKGGDTVVSVPLGLVSGVQEWLAISSHELVLLVCGVALMLGIHLLLQRTTLGKSMRAMADNRELARARGVPTARVRRWTWIIGSSTTGMAGFLIAFERGTISFLLGWQLLILIFAAVILGGIGSVYGAILGGLVIGLSSTVSLVWLPEAVFVHPVAYLIMFVVLLIRPRGLFGGREIG